MAIFPKFPYGYKFFCWKSIWQPSLWGFTRILPSFHHHQFMIRGGKNTEQEIKEGSMVENDRGPASEYDSRVAAGYLKKDSFQRGIVRSLQRLHEELQDSHAPGLTHPSKKDLKYQFISLSKKVFSAILKFRKRKNHEILPEHMPRGLYLYGDVGSGKTMLMDLFYDTLPKKVTSKTRLHFHNFMQDVHKRIHNVRLERGIEHDVIPLVAAEIAEKGNVLCFDEFQCTDVADAMILRRLLEALLNHGVVLVTTSNRHPDDLYLNGLQRESFIPCIKLLKDHLDVINLDSDIDYRKLPRPSSNVYYTPLDVHSVTHAEKWFKYFGDSNQERPHSEIKNVWGREIFVPRVSGRAAMFTFHELIGGSMSAADYIELTKNYDAFIVTDIHAMTYFERDLARRFITFIDAVYEASAILVLTSAVKFNKLFLSKEEVLKNEKISEGKEKSLAQREEIDDSMRNLIDDLGVKMDDLKNSSIFTGDEERFAFSRALSRLSEMGSQEWVKRAISRMKGLSSTHKSS